MAAPSPRKHVGCRAQRKGTSTSTLWELPSSPSRAAYIVTVHLLLKLVNTELKLSRCFATTSSVGCGTFGYLKLAVYLPNSLALFSAGNETNGK